MSQRKWILMLSTSERGGIATSVDWTMNSEIGRRWHPRLLITHVEGSLARRLLQAGTSYLRFLFWLLSGRTAAVHCHVSMRGSFWRKSLFAETARAFGVPVIFHLHGSRTREFHAGLPPWGKALVRRQLERSRAVIVLSESWREFVLGIAPGAQITVAPNCVHVPASTPLRRAAPGAPAAVALRLLFLGLVGQRKGVHDLLAAFALALRECPGLHLCIGGNGEVEAARQLAHELGIAEQVDLCGWVDASARTSLLARADIFLLPSYNEGLPMSVLEAMAHRLPVITTPVGGIPELIVDRHNGLLVAPGDVAGLRDAMVSLARDPALRLNLGNAGHATVLEGYGGARTVAAIESVYRKLGLEPRRSDGWT